MKGQENQGMFGPSFGQPPSYNYFPSNGDYNTWGSQQINAGPVAQSKKGPPYDDYYRDHSYPPGHDGIKGVEHGMHGLSLDMGSSLSHGHDNDHSHTHLPTSKPDLPKETVPKKMTWASIASQPAKPQIRANSSSSILKKKGPGMPPPPMVPGKHNMDIGTWDSPSKNGPALVPPPPPVITPPAPIEPSPLSQTKSNNNNNNAPAPAQSPIPAQTMGGPASVGLPHNMHMHQRGAGPVLRPAWSGSNNRVPHPGMMPSAQNQRSMGPPQGPPPMMPFQGPPHPQHQPVMNQQQQPHQPPMSQHMQPHHQLTKSFMIPDLSGSNNSLDNPVLEELRDKNEYNPQDFDFETTNLARFFVIKSYSEDDIHRSIKYEIWCSTEHGNKRLDQAYREREKVAGVVYLLFSVNGSGHFCGMAQMMTAVDYNSVSSVWSQDKWKGTFKVKWIYVKDVPNTQFRHIRLENNENKAVTNSRDTQEVPNAQGIQVLRILSTYKHVTSIFDDFIHYEKRQEEEDTKKVEPPSNYDGGMSKQYQGGSYDKSGHGMHQGSGGSGYDRGGSKNYGGGNFNNRGGYQNYDNRRGDDFHRGGGGGSGFDRQLRDDAGGSGSYNRDGGDYYRSNRNDYRDQRRDDRGGNNGGYMSRDRDNMDGGGGGGYGIRNDGNKGIGGHRGDNYRDRGEHHNNRGRGRGYHN